MFGLAALVPPLLELAAQLATAKDCSGPLLLYFQRACRHHIQALLMFHASPFSFRDATDRTINFRMYVPRLPFPRLPGLVSHRDPLVSVAFRVENGGTGPGSQGGRS